MHPETPNMNLKGFTHVTAILALCAKPTHVGGGHRL